MAEGVSNAQILSAIMDLKQDMGGVRADAANAHKFAASVSAKADRIEAKIDRHVTDPEAHGAGLERRAADKSSGALREWLAPLVTGAVLLGLEALIHWKP